MNLNKVMLIGNLTRDPELRSTPAGDSVAGFSIATNFTWKDKAGQKQEKAEFHNIVAWRKLAEIIGQYLKKGSKIYIEGRLQTRNWEDQNGTKRYRTEIIADNMIMLDSKGKGDYTENSPAPAQASEQPAPPAEDEINVEDIPF
jgi:single-strand DNA-binding protein